MSSGCISCLLFQRVSWFLFYYYFFSCPMPLLGHLSHSAERETEEKEEEAEPSAWHRILGPYCLLWSSSTSQASPGPWRGDASRPQSSLRGVDFLPTATFPRGLCLLVAAPLLPGRCRCWGVEAGSGQPPRGSSRPQIRAEWTPSAWPEHTARSQPWSSERRLAADPAQGPRECQRAVKNAFRFPSLLCGPRPRPRASHN